MKDLKSQLSALTGVAVPEAAPAAAPPPTDPLLGEYAHLGDPWFQRLSALRVTISGAPKMSPRPKLGQARQVTDQLLKLLKKAGRKRDARDLAGLRAAFVSRRDKAAWSVIKARFTSMGLSEKAYRGIKQGKSDPLKVLAKLDRADPATLGGMGAKRLRELLTS